MFKVETNMGSKTLREIHATDNADRAIHFFISVLDKMRPTESARLVRDGEVMARKTPKTTFLHADWR